MMGVLVVEDDPLSMECVVEMLTACGFTAETAVNGKEAVKKVENEVSLFTFSTTYNQEVKTDS